MAGFWNKKTPTLTLVLSGIVDVSLFIAVSEDSRFRYWPPVILLVAIVLTIFNNFRIERLVAEDRNRRKDRGAEVR